MTSTTERQQFEEWFTNKYPRSYWGVEKTASGEYQGGLAAPLWEAWQESRGCMANREAQPVQVTDGMALDFHHALTDGSIGSDELEEIKVGLRAALCNVTATPAPAAPEEMLAQPVSGGYKLPEGCKLVPAEPTAEMINAALASGALSIRTVYRVMLAAAPEGGNDHDTRR